MDNQHTIRFRAACDTFLVTPTQANQGLVTEAAELYREDWIATQASGKSPKTPASDSVQPGPTSYARKIETQEILANGVPVRLALQERTSTREDTTWWVVSWRAKLSPTGPNRRFYLSSGEYWSLPLKTAITLMDELADKGGLDEKYFDDRKHDFTAQDPLISDNMSAAEKSEWSARLFADEEDWGPNPYFVIVNDPNENWKKVLIANRETGVVTFRSITTDASYMPKKVLRPGSDWYLDNSMMDAGVQQMRVFRGNLRHLQSIGQ